MRFEKTQLEKLIEAAVKRKQLRQDGIRLSEKDIWDTGIFARLADDETVTGQWEFVQDLILRANTGFKGIITHENTADRTYILPNESGTVVVERSFENKSGVTLLAGTLVMSFNNGVTKYDGTRKPCGFYVADTENAHSGVVRSAGHLYKASWGLVPDSRYFGDLGNPGSITRIVVTGIKIQSVGSSVTTDVLNINIGEELVL